jgi:hypothetical protein
MGVAPIPCDQEPSEFGFVFASLLHIKSGEQASAPPIFAHLQPEIREISLRTAILFAVFRFKRRIPKQQTREDRSEATDDWDEVHANLKLGAARNAGTDFRVHFIIRAG